MLIGVIEFLRFKYGTLEEDLEDNYGSPGESLENKYGL
jgi:hypothetical protein